VASSFGHSLQSEEIEELATVSERIVHGNPSGVDVSVAVHGGLILFKKGHGVQRVETDGNVELIVGVSGMERRTSEMVQRFAEVKDRFPGLFDGMVEASSRFSDMAAEALIRKDLPTLGSFLNYQHIILKAFGVSAEILDRMVEGALRNGALGAKLTGAGGGGSMIALPPPGGAERLRSILIGFGADAFVTSIPTGGVRTWRLHP
jgi:mevalonate kinase